MRSEDGCSGYVVFNKLLPLSLKLGDARSDSIHFGGEGRGEGDELRPIEA